MESVKCPLCHGKAEPIGEGSAILVCKDCAYYFVEHEKWDFIKREKEDEQD
jgi:ribosome-binding protein aMBF1 (putative translation factor)